MRRFLLLTVTLAAGFVAALTAHAMDVVKIGCLLPLSGPMAHNGEDCRDAMVMELEKLETAENLHYDYQLVFEDDQNTPRLTAQGLKKLLDIDHVRAVTSVFSGPGTTVAPIAENKQIPHLGCAFSADAAKGNFNFVHWSTPQPSAKLMAEFCVKMGYKKIVSLSQNQAGYIALDKAFQDIAPSYGLTYGLIERTNPDTRDFRTSLLKLRSEKADLLLLNLFQPQLDIAFRQVNELGIETPLGAIGGWGASHTPLAFGYYYTDSAKPKMEFVNSFAARYGRTPVNFAGNLADNISLIVFAHEKWQGEGLPTGEFVAKTLAEVKDFEGIRGKLTPNADGFFDSPPLLMTQTPNGFEVVDLESLKK